MTTNHNTLTKCQMYGEIFRRRVQYTMGKGFTHKDLGELGHDLVAVYEATRRLPENSGGKD